MSSSPQHPSDPTDPTDPTGTAGAGDPVARALSGLADGVVPPPPRSPAGARRTARRRQGARVAGAGLLVAAVVVGVPLGLGFGSPVAAPLPPATEVASDPATLPAPSAAAASPTPSSVPVGPSVEAEPSAAPPSSSADPAPEPSGEATGAGPQVPATIGPVAATDTGPAAAGELLGLDPGTAGLPEIFPESDKGGPASWVLDPCRPTAYPLDARRTGWWSQVDFVGDGGASYQAATFADEATAQAVVDGFARVTGSCWTPWQTSPLPESDSTVWRAYPVGGAGLQGVARDYRPAAPDELADPRRGAQYVAVVREGVAVALVVGYDDFGGTSAATSQGDGRPGAGAGIGEETQEEAEARVRSRLDEARARASGLAVAALRQAALEP